MLSIAIPVYNFEVVDLCATLSKQAKLLGIAFEILCFDDCSQEEYRNFNRRVSQFEGVEYRELDKNQGRSAIRNLLAKEAKFEFLLFMDCDSEVENHDYLKNYLQYLPGENVIYGGRSYKLQAPEKQFMLRWKYGNERESKSAEERNKESYRSFMTNNFVVKKSRLIDCPFNEDLEGYGHEDTLFAIDLKEKGIEIIHIDNPLCHIGLESAEEYIYKTEQGVSNLARIIKMGKLGANNKLYGSYLKLKKFGLLKAFRFYAKKNKTKMLTNLKSEDPNLRYFDLLKLYFLSESL